MSIASAIEALVGRRAKVHDAFVAGDFPGVLPDLESRFPPQAERAVNGLALIKSRCDRATVADVVVALGCECSNVSRIPNAL